MFNFINPLTYSISEIILKSSINVTVVTVTMVTVAKRLGPWGVTIYSPGLIDEYFYRRAKMAVMLSSVPSPFFFHVFTNFFKQVSMRAQSNKA